MQQPTLSKTIALKSFDILGADKTIKGIQPGIDNQSVHAVFGLGGCHESHGQWLCFIKGSVRRY